MTTDNAQRTIGEMRGATRRISEIKTGDKLIPQSSDVTLCVVGFSNEGVHVRGEQGHMSVIPYIELRASAFTVKKRRDRRDR